jgi:hypothetical protein
VGAVQISQSAGGRRIGADLYDPGVRDPKAMVAVSGDSVKWTQPLASVFSLHGESTDWGWNFDRIAAPGLFVGSVGGPPVESTATAGTISPARAMTAGFRTSDGSVAWQDAGTIYACGQPLPCPGQGGGGAGSPTTGLRFRVAGTVSVSQSGGAPTLSPVGAVTLQGFELATGKTLWSYRAGRDVSLLQDMPMLPRSQVVAPSSVQYKTPIGYSNGAGGTAYQRIADWAPRPGLTSYLATPTVPDDVVTEITDGFFLRLVHGCDERLGAGCLPGWRRRTGPRR